MTELETRLGYAFLEKELLTAALTHSSFANENRGWTKGSNERLEFLGDAVLGFITAEYLFKTRPDLPEGKMTRLRAEMVCEKSLSAVAQKLDLGESLRLGKGEENGGGRQRPSILADTVEAVLAAIYLDGGFKEARKFVMRLIVEPFSENEGGDRDYKTELQELVQQKSGQTLEYVLKSESGPDHNKMFEIEVTVNGRSVGLGVGRSKKDAEQAAAKMAVEKLS